MPYQDPTYIADLLDQAARFADDQWTQGCYARNAQDEAVHWNDPDAVQHCAAGRLFKVTQDLRSSPDLYHEVAKNLPGYRGNLGGWNDVPGRTPEQVRRLFRQTAAALRKTAEETDQEQSRQAGTPTQS